MKKNFALFGLSRNKKSISREIFELLVGKGYNIFPINPNADKIDSIFCYETLDDVDQKLDGAIFITNPKISADVVKQCQAKGINDLWFQYETMDDELKAYCKANSINFINSCVLLHHKEARFPHSVHRFFYQLLKR
jgi:predicted CoA-binding protein